MKIAVTLAVAWIAGMVYFWPHYTYYRLERAVIEHKLEDIAEFVDFPAYRESMRAQIAVTLPARLRDLTSNHRFSAASENMAASFLAAEVEGNKTPEKFGQLGKKASSGYVNASRFDIVTRTPEDPNELTRLVLLRHGLRWKLAGIELPAYKPKTAAGEAAVRPQPKFELPALAAVGNGFEGLALNSREAAIVTAFGARLHKLPERMDWGIRYVDYTIREHAIGGVPMEILFQMDKSSDTLEQVLGRKSTESSATRLYDKDFLALASHFTAKHGPHKIEGTPHLTDVEIARRYRWEDGGITIEISQSAFMHHAKGMLGEQLFVRYF